MGTMIKATSSCDLQLDEESTSIIEEEQLDADLIVMIAGAAATNNLGVERLIAGDLNGAMGFFREALEDAKLAFSIETIQVDPLRLERARYRIVTTRREEAQSQYNIGSFTSSPTFAGLHRAQHNTQGNHHNSSSNNDIEDTSLTSRTPSVFSLPFSILINYCAFEKGDDTAFFSPDIDVDNAIFSAIIVFNMAIVTHNMLQLEPTGSSKKEDIRVRATKLYDMCGQLLSNAADQANQACRQDPSVMDTPPAAPDPPHHDPREGVSPLGRLISDMMSMAILNNQADLFLCTADSQRSIIHMAYLLELIAYTNMQHYGCSPLNFAMQRAIEFFQNSAFRSIGSPEAAPAA